MAAVRHHIRDGPIGFVHGKPFLFRDGNSIPFSAGLYTPSVPIPFAGHKIGQRQSKESVFMSEITRPIDLLTASLRIPDAQAESFSTSGRSRSGVGCAHCASRESRSAGVFLFVMTNRVASAVTELSISAGHR